MTWRPDDREDWPGWNSPDVADRVGVERVLRMVAEHKLHPEMAVTWTRSVSPPSGDEALGRVWVLLTHIADRLDPGTYIYSESDLLAWVDELGTA